MSEENVLMTDIAAFCCLVLMVYLIVTQILCYKEKKTKTPKKRKQTNSLNPMFMEVALVGLRLRQRYGIPRHVVPLVNMWCPPPPDKGYPYMRPPYSNRAVTNAFTAHYYGVFGTKGVCWVTTRKGKHWLATGHEMKRVCAYCYKEMVTCTLSRTKHWVHTACYEEYKRFYPEEEEKIK